MGSKGNGVDVAEIEDVEGLWCCRQKLMMCLLGDVSRWMLTCHHRAELRKCRAASSFRHNRDEASTVVHYLCSRTG